MGITPLFNSHFTDLNYQDLGETMEFSWQGKIVRLQGVSDTDWIYSLIRKTGTFYEIDLLKYIRYAMKGRSGCMLDIGANIGNHSVFFGMFVSDTVICFEPNPIVLPILKANLTENHIRHKLYQLGLSDREGEADIELPSTAVNNIGAARLIENQADISGSIRIATLDSLLPEIKAFTSGLNIIALKMDVEGMEPAVLRGARKVLDEYKPDLFIEVQNQDQMEKIEAILIPLGYNRVVSWAATPVWHFVHRNRWSIIRMIRLFVYILLHKSVPFASLIYSKIRSF
jgi:protein O-GlcNAc transferase